jgi:UDP-glucose 4-epimerase
MRNVIVTGAAGFIGFPIADALSLMPDVHVYAIDNHIRGAADDAYLALCKRRSVTAFDVDLTDSRAVQELPENCDVIIHLAALNGTQNFYERPYEVVRCSTLPTFHLLDRYGPSGQLQRFVYAGSSEAYAGTVQQFHWPVPTDEQVPLCISDPLNPRWSYGASKLHGEVLVINACRQFGAEYTIIRYHNVYGPRMGDKHMIPDFLERMNEGVYALYGHNDTRSFMYIADAVRATLMLTGSADAANEIVNVGSEQEVKIHDIGKTLLRLADIKADIELHDSPPGSVPRRAPDLQKLRRLVDFREQWTLEEGLRATMDFYLKNRAGA